MNPLELLRTKLASITADAKAIEASAAAAGRAEFTTDETTKLGELHAAFQATEAQIALHERNAQIEASAAVPQPTKTQPAPVAAQSAARVQAVSATHQNHGFTRGIGEFFAAVKMAAMGRVDQRLLNAVTTYGGENIGPDGGFAVPPDYRAAITEAWGDDDNLINLFSPISTSSNILTLVTDETTPWSSSGITGAWTDEAGTITATKPVLKQVNIPLRKVASLVHLSDEMTEDSPAIASYIAKKMGQKLASLVSQAIVSGDGVGKPQGLTNAPSYVQVTRTTAHKIKAEDVTNMVARLRPGGFGKAFWLTHSSRPPAALDDGARWLDRTIPIFATDYTKSPFGTLLGRPIHVTEYASDLVTGTSNATTFDLLLVNPDGYAIAVKSGGVQTAATIAFAFDQSLQSFRATMRVGGQALLSAAITRASGSDTLSDIVGVSHV